MSKPSDHVIRDKRQLQCLVNPVTQGVFDAVRSETLMSVMDIAAQLGLAADVINYHVKKLEKSGLILMGGMRGHGRSAERLFECANPNATVLFDPKDRDNIELLNKAVASMLSLAQKDFHTAFNPEMAVTSGPGRNLRAARVSAWLTEKEWLRVNAMIEKIIALMHRKAKHTRDDEKLYAISMITAPMPIQPLKRARNHAATN